MLTQVALGPISNRVYMDRPVHYSRRVSLYILVQLSSTAMLRTN